MVSVGLMDNNPEMIGKKERAFVEDRALASSLRAALRQEPQNSKELSQLSRVSLIPYDMSLIGSLATGLILAGGKCKLSKVGTKYAKG